jgi:anti-sigma factor RsiW
MNCNQSTTMIAAYADGELDGLRGRTIEKHLRDCPECAARHRNVLALRASIRAEVPRYAASPALRARVQALIDGAAVDDAAVDNAAVGNAAMDTAVAANAMAAMMRSPLEGRRWDRWRWLSAGAVAGCAATVLAWVIGGALLDWRANEDLAVEAVATHVRATLDNHLIAIASSDQHTVKPWLSARLDYSPPVRDLSRDGFTLAGGRLDYLDRRPVATLVYRYRLHTIDVFVRPEAARAPPFAPRTIRGFNVAHGTGSGMEWLAVSDVSADVLASLVERLARADAPP